MYKCTFAHYNSVVGPIIYGIEVKEAQYLKMTDTEKLRFRKEQNSSSGYTPSTYYSNSSDSSSPGDYTPNSYTSDDSGSSWGNSDNSNDNSSSFDFGGGDGGGSGADGDY